MKTFRFNSVVPTGCSLIRRFGRATLWTDRQGCWRLLGGRRTERLEAREWVSLFCHDALVNTTESAELPALAPFLKRLDSEV